MLLRRVAVENVRSFLDRQELVLDGPISILIGPNGGGKTNLLDVAVTMLRRYLFASMYAAHAPSGDLQERYEFRANDALNNMRLEKHSLGANRNQLVEIELELTARDRENMIAMKAEAANLIEKAKYKYFNLPLTQANNWDIGLIKPGDRFTYTWNGDSIVGVSDPASVQFKQYINLFEIDNWLRAEFATTELSLPMVYLPVGRSANAFASRTELAGYNDFDQKRTVDAIESRAGSSIVPLAIGRLAQKFRLLLEKDTGGARKTFKSDENIKQLSALLGELGYEWELESVDPLKNAYDIRLRKQGSSFLVRAASSGEKELLTYLFAIFALNVRDALVVVDEPELHLHPRWQKILIELFVKLAATTGNQFLLATHSPTFISPDTVHYVSRVFSVEQKSTIIRLAQGQLPEMRHLLNVVNSQNNESIFFADEVVLVEGLSDRIFFEAVFDKFGRRQNQATTMEIVSVGGKGLFSSYAKLLSACQVPYSIIADRDYIEQVGTEEIKNLFVVNAGEIKSDVIENAKSLDGDSLVSRIESAMASGSWEDARETWEYIKSRRRKLRPNLSDGDQEKLEKFIVEQQANKLFILGQGALEDYLPEGFRSKDIGKLIELVARPNFWETLPLPAQKELRTIALALMPKSAGLANRPVDGSAGTTKSLWLPKWRQRPSHRE